MRYESFTTRPGGVQPHDAVDRRPGAKPEAHRLAILIAPRGARSVFAAERWLGACYGINQVQRLSVPRREWDALAGNSVDRKATEKFKDRLALALLGRPVLFAVVVGQPALALPGGQPLPMRRDAQRVAGRIRSWGIGIRIIGIQINLPADADGADGLRDDYGHWLAECAWEDDGGRNVSAWTSDATTDRHTHGRQQSAALEPDGAIARGTDGEPPWHPAATDVPRFRPDLAGVA